MDVSPETWTIDPKCIEKAITARTKAIIPVHLYGRMCDMDAIMDIAKRHNLYVIEDCAHQHGSEWRGMRAGTIGNVGSFSLQASKIMQTGEGGLCTTNDEDLYNRIYSLKFCGRPRLANQQPPLPTMQSGNFRANEFTAVIGLCQLARLEEQNKLRAANADYLEDALQSEIPGLSYLYRDPRVTLQAHYSMSMRYNKDAWDGLSRNTLLAAFKAETEGVLGFNVPYEPLNMSPLYQPLSKQTHKLSDEYCKAIDPSQFSLPVVEKAYKEEGMGLSHWNLLGARSELDKIVDIFKKLHKNLGDLKKYENSL